MMVPPVQLRTIEKVNQLPLIHIDVGVIIHAPNRIHCNFNERYLGPGAQQNNRRKLHSLSNQYLQRM